MILKEEWSLYGELGSFAYLWGFTIKTHKGLRKSTWKSFCNRNMNRRVYRNVVCSFKSEVVFGDRFIYLEI